MTSLKGKKILVVILISLIGLFYLTSIRKGHNWGDDFAQYLQHAINLADGRNYDNLGYINNPLRLLPKAYPPIYPILILPIYKLFGLNFTAFKIELVIFFILFLIIAYNIFKGDLPFPYLLATLSIIGFHPLFWNFKDQIVSDIPFLFFTYCSLLLINRFFINTHTQINQIFSIILISLIIYLSCGTRSVGIVLIPSLVFYDILSNKRISKTSIIITLIVGFLLLLQNFFFGGESSYLKVFSFQYYSSLLNIMIFINNIGQLWNNGYSIYLTYILSIILSMLSMLGFYIKIKNNLTVFELFNIFYVSVIIIMPWHFDQRYLIPILPFYVFYIFYAINNYRILNVRKRGWLVFIMVNFLVLSSYIGYYAKTNLFLINEGVEKPATVELFTYIKNNTSSKDIIIFEKPRVITFFTVRKSSALSKVDEGDLLKLYYRRPWVFLASNKILSGQGVDEDILLKKYYYQLWKYIKSIKANYIVTMPLDKVYFGWFINAYKDNLVEVFHNSDFTVYKIKTYSYNE